jgi:hypothetical protein
MRRLSTNSESNGTGSGERLTGAPVTNGTEAAVQPVNGWSARIAVTFLGAALLIELLTDQTMEVVLPAISALVIISGASKYFEYLKYKVG